MDTMTTVMMIAFVAATVVGGAILGWVARAYSLGLHNEVDLFDRGEVGDTKHGD